MDKRSELENVLQELGKLQEIIGSAVVRRDGLLIASSGLSERVNTRAVAAMAAAIVGTAETSVNELGIGVFSQVIVEASEGKYVCIGAGKEAVLITLIRMDANLGLVLLEMEKAVKKIMKILD